MPVWHEQTKAWRESGDLVVVGIVQEQHPERAQLYQQWREYDWPILWDPLNLTGSRAVPAFWCIDPTGLVAHDSRSLRGAGGSLETLDEHFLKVPHPEPVREAGQPVVLHSQAMLDPSGGVHDWSESDAWARLLWGGVHELGDVIGVLEKALPKSTDAGVSHFRLGVAYQRRYDNGDGTQADFQAAVDHWGKALASNPNQYIWRRRIQQYGPRLDKPYPFYDWVAQAQKEIRARGEQPVHAGPRLTGSELAGSTRRFEAGEEATSPDPEGKIDRDGADGGDPLISIVATVAPATVGPRGKAGATARVHLDLRPTPGAASHWNNEVDALRIWLELPEGWSADQQLLVAPWPKTPTSNETRRLDFEVLLPEGVAGGTRFSAYALYHVCEDKDGQCLYRRQDIEIEIP